MRIAILLFTLVLSSHSINTCAQENLLGRSFADISGIFANYHIETGSTSSGNLIIDVYSMDSNGNIYVLHQFIFDKGVFNSTCVRYGMNISPNQLQAIVNRYNRTYNKTLNGWNGIENRGFINGKIINYGENYRAEWEYSKLNY